MSGSKILRGMDREINQGTNIFHRGCCHLLDYSYACTRCAERYTGMSCMQGIAKRAPFNQCKQKGVV